MSRLARFSILFILACTCDAFAGGFSRCWGLKDAKLKANLTRHKSSSGDYIHTLKTDLLRIAAKTNRGDLASDAQIESALDLVTQLESMNSTDSNEAEEKKYSIEGTWDLVFTDAQLFQSSPVFLTIRELYGEDAAKAKQAFNLHRAATNTGEIGVVQQVITSSQLISKVNIRNGLIPGVPFSLRGEIISTADLQILDRYTMKLTMKETAVEKSNIPFGLGSMLAVASIPVGQLLKAITGKVPECSLNTFYLDNDLRITRNKDDNVFVYLRGDSSTIL